jgi:hypothetical protein
MSAGKIESNMDFISIIENIIDHPFDDVITDAEIKTLLAELIKIMEISHNLDANIETLITQYLKQILSL